MPGRPANDRLAAAAGPGLFLVSPRSDPMVRTGCGIPVRHLRAAKWRTGTSRAVLRSEGEDGGRLDRLVSWGGTLDVGQASGGTDGSGDAGQEHRGDDRRG